ncbi:MAG TPA: hypothetical protein VKR58_11940 [Aquella sp.]|nr:hypothetical protein [Aquella sp.]
MEYLFEFLIFVFIGFCLGYLLGFFLNAKSHFAYFLTTLREDIHNFYVKLDNIHDIVKK